jgi:polyhydroxyalkanoate synthesis regulator phasin
MNSFLRSGFLLGIGAAVAGKEKLDETLMKLVEKGKMTQTEADTIFDDYFKKGETKSEEWNEEFRAMAKAQLSDLGFVTRDEFDIVKAQLMLVQEEIAQIRNSNQQSDLNKTDRGNDSIPPGFSKEVE